MSKDREKKLYEARRIKKQIMYHTGASEAFSYVMLHLELDDEDAMKIEEKVEFHSDRIKELEIRLKKMPDDIS